MEVLGAVLAMIVFGLLVAVAQGSGSEFQGDAPVKDLGAPGPDLVFGGRVVASWYRRTAIGWSTTLTTTDPGIPRSLEVTRQGWRSKRGDVVVHDERLDPLADIRGDPAETIARLDGEVRPLLVALLQAGGRVADGELTRELRGRVGGEALTAAAHDLAALVRPRRGGGRLRLRRGRAQDGRPPTV